jgi:tetratricopeptide (TPR) repeat protein
VPNLTRLALSRGGRWVAVAANFPVRAAVLDALSGGEVHAILEGTGHLAFSPEGSRLFLGAEAEIRALEVGTWDLVWSCPREYGGGQGGMIAVSRDSRLIFAGLSKSRVGLLEAATGRELVQFSLTGGGDVSSLAIADRSKLAIASTRDSFELWDLVEVERDLERYQLTLGLRREEPRAARQTTAIEVSGATGPLAEDIGPRLERGGKIEGLTQVIQSDPRSPDGYAERAETLRRSGLRLEAIADLARALERKPREPAPLLLRRAKLLEAEGRFEECAADALRALELDAGLIAARKLRAAALERLGDEAGALREWEAAREAAPTDPVVMERIAWILLTGPEELRHPERALSLARGALFADPGRQAAQRTLGIACWRSGLAAEARSALERAAAHPEADAFTWFFLSMARARGGDAAGAEQAFARGTARLAEAERLSTFPRPSLLRLQEIRAEAAQAPSG